MKKNLKSRSVFKLMILMVGICICLLTGCGAEFTSITPDGICVTSHPHNEESFTEGLFFYNGQLCESTGLCEKSALYMGIDSDSGKAAEEYHYTDEKIFAEGATVFNGQIYVLTYKNNKAFVFDPDTLQIIREIDYPRDGWGLTTDGEYLIASDGSSSLFYYDENFKLIKELPVTQDGEQVTHINELEYINGAIWANVWMENRIIVIDSESGNVIKEMDFTGLLPENYVSGDQNDVLNGIAYDSENHTVYITGKRWPLMFTFSE